MKQVFVRGFELLTICNFNMFKNQNPKQEQFNYSIRFLQQLTN